MRKINIPPVELVITVSASLLAILNNSPQPVPAFIHRQPNVLGPDILYLKSKVVVLIRLPIVVAGLLGLARAIPSEPLAARAPETSAADSPVLAVAKLDAARVAVPFLTLHQVSGVLGDLFKVESVFGDIVLGWARDRTGNGRYHYGQDSEDVSDLHDEDRGSGL